MNRLVSFVLAVSIMVCSSSYAVEQDKALHFGVSTGINTATYVVLSGMLGRGTDVRVPALVVSSLLTLGVGFVKEFDDAAQREQLGQKFQIDGGDMAANMIGIAVSAAAIYFIDIHNSKSSHSLKVNSSGAQFAYKF